MSSLSSATEPPLAAASAADTPALQARRLFQTSQHGVLSTHSQELPGYPFGSLVTYSVDAQGQPILLLSDIAQHTHNIRADARVSLTLTEVAADSQAAGRLTLLGDVERLADAEGSDVAERYLRRFPAARQYHHTHDFAYYRLVLCKARYIGGFGRIHWINANVFRLDNPFAGASETAMVRHMNEDHADGLRDYCRLAGLTLAEGDAPRMTAIDAEGFDIHIGHRLLRLPFEAPLATAKDVRMAMVALAKRARGEGAATPMAPATEHA